jgi:TolC family type I secretion outer membrane protein
VSVKRTVFVLTACAFAAGWSLPAAAQVLDLAQAYRLASENDANIRASRAATEARAERVPQARSQLLPNVSANASAFRNNLVSTVPGFGNVPIVSHLHYNSSSRSLTLRQPIYRPFQMADYRQAKAQVEQANAELERDEQSLAVRLTTAYLQLLGAQDQLELVLAQKAAYQTQLESARKRFAGGAGTRTDIDEAQARYDLAVAQELEARQNLGYTRQQLQSMVVDPVKDIARIDEARLPLVPPTPDSADQWIERAIATSPEVRALEAQRRAAQLEIDKARAGHLPTLDAVAQRSISDSDQVTSVNTRYDQKAIGLQLSVPLFSGGYVSSQVRQAAAELRRTEESLEALKRDLALRVNKEYRGVSEGVLRVRALEQAVRSAGTAVESSRKSFQAGSRTLVDILNAEGQYASAQRDLYDARYVYLLSRIRLRALAGEADVGVIDEANGWLKR